MIQGGEVAIRRLEAADSEAFRDLRRAALKADPVAFMAHPDDPEEAKQEPDHWRWRVLRSPVWAAVAPGGRLLGMCGWYRGPGIKIAHRAFLWGLFVRQEARGQKLARRLLDAVTAEVREAEGIESLWAGATDGQEAAIRLYESMGFRSCGLHPRALKVGDRFLDERMLVLFFQEEGALPGGGAGGN